MVEINNNNNKNNNGKHVCSIYSNILLYAMYVLYTLTHLLLISLWIRDYYYPLFTMKKLQSREVQELSKFIHAAKWYTTQAVCLLNANSLTLLFILFLFELPCGVVQWPMRLCIISIAVFWHWSSKFLLHTWFRN